jgi:demethylmenaquinone methyltransferase/2-methoxy-6-polyprenyl-1,4-benzoquinol methylase
MFDRIAPVYDAMNRVMTAGLDRRWRRLTAVAVVRPGDRVLDSCCGTGDLALACLRAGGRVTGLDFSERMLERARRKSNEIEWVHGDALALPFADRSFERVFTGHFYGHLHEYERRRFLREARRVAPELVVLDSALRDEVEPEEWQQRTLNDGSSWQVYKRYFATEELAAELGGGRTIFAGTWFVLVQG